MMAFVFATIEPMAVAALIVSIFAALFTGWQALEARAARRQAGDAFAKQAEDAKTSAVAADRSAKAAEESATIAREGLTRTQRAYVALDVIRLQGDPGSRPFVVQVEVRNLGTTPALEVTEKSAWALQPPLGPAESISYPQNHSAPVPLAPGQPLIFTITVPAGLTPTDLDDIERGNKQLMVWGLSNTKTFLGSNTQRGIVSCIAALLALHLMGGLMTWSDACGVQALI